MKKFDLARAPTNGVIDRLPSQQREQRFEGTAELGDGTRLSAPSPHGVWPAQYQETFGKARSA